MPVSVIHVLRYLMISPNERSSAGVPFLKKRKYYSLANRSPLGSANVGIDSAPTWFERHLPTAIKVLKYTALVAAAALATYITVQGILAVAGFGAGGVVAGELCLRKLQLHTC